MHTFIKALLILLLPCLLQAQTLSLSFDDGLDPRQQPQASAWNAALLSALAQAKLKAILLPAGKRVNSPAGLAMVRAWGEAGHAIGNHTYSHNNLGDPATTLQAFEADVLKNEVLLASLPGWTKRLRFPYLKEGETQAKRDGFRAWLREHRYSAAPVSIDASDWYYNARYLDWRKSHPESDAAPFREAYIRHLLDRATYYEGLAQKTLGRSPSHILLLHTNAINAAFLPQVMAAFRHKGWMFIDTREALKDPLYTLQPQTLPAGESILWALAKQQQIPGLRYPGEDDVYEKPILDAVIKASQTHDSNTPRDK